MINNLLVVCIGNICRSPMVEGLFKERLLEKQKNIRVSSAGLQALATEPAVPEARQVMRDIGIDISGHRARQLTQEMVFGAELILVMEKSQKKKIEAVFPNSFGRVHLLGKWAGFEVPDPFLQPIEEFTYCLKLIEQGWQDWQHRIG